MFLNIMAVGCGGFIGAVCRYLVAQLSNAIALSTLHQDAFRFPLGTFAANFIGCFLMGLLAIYIPQHFPNQSRLLLFVTTGCLGGFTTFSTFGLDTYKLFVAGDYKMACIYFVASLACCMAGLVAGVAAAKALTA